MIVMVFLMNSSNDITNTSTNTLDIETDIDDNNAKTTNTIGAKMITCRKIVLSN